MTGTSTPRLSRSLREHLGHGGRGGIGVDRDADELRAGVGEARDLDRGRVGVGGVGVGHRLDDDRVRRADQDARRRRPRPAGSAGISARSLASRSARSSAVPPTCVAMSNTVIQIRNVNSATKPDGVGQLLGAQRDLLAEARDRLEHDHQHPAAVEGRERQEVHQREVGRQDPGHVQQVSIGAAVRGTRRRARGRDADGPGRRRRLVGVRDDRAARSPRPSRIRPNAVDRALRPADLDRLGERTPDRRPTDEPADAWP